MKEVQQEPIPRTDPQQPEEAVLLIAWAVGHGQVAQAFAGLGADYSALTLESQ